MTQMMIEQLTQEEYSNLLAYGDPVTNVDIACITAHTNNDSQELDWISTLESTTFPDMTFGYQEPVTIAASTCISTAVC